MGGEEDSASSARSICPASRCCSAFQSSGAGTGWWRHVLRWLQNELWSPLNDPPVLLKEVAEYAFSNKESQRPRC